jgi:hypothetical protein
LKDAKILILGLIGILVFVVAASGCTSSTTNETKKYDNGIISFDYPANMNVEQNSSTIPYEINIQSMPSGVSVFQSFFKETFASYFEIFKTNLANDNNKLLKVTKFSIDGNPAYNLTLKDQNGTISYTTLIKLKTSIIQVSPYKTSNGQDQKTTESYKAYDLILKTLKIK